MMTEETPSTEVFDIIKVEPPHGSAQVSSMLYQNKYRVESARLKDWDYSTSAWYYVTINSKNHQIWFGKIVDGKMKLNEFGEVVDEYWNKIPDHNSGVELDEYVLMPNHIHGIIIINERLTVETPHGASLHL